MRLINVSTPAGKSALIAEIAFSIGIEKISVQKEEICRRNGSTEIKEIIKIEASTPNSKRFVDALLKADFFDPEQFPLVVRGARSIVSHEPIKDITVPLPDAPTDILEELFQFSHVTYSLIGRIFIAASLLAYGMIIQNILLMVAGLLFLPMLPILQAIGFGAWTRQWKLLRQGLTAFLIIIVLLILAGATVASLSSPPLKFDEFGSISVGFLLSLAVGIASGLAIIDDTGRREMIGLAASSQAALVPVWFGICLIFGFPETTGENEVRNHAISFFINVLTLIIASLAIHIFSGTADGGLKRINSK